MKRLKIKKFIELIVKLFRSIGDIENKPIPREKLTEPVSEPIKEIECPIKINEVKEVKKDKNIDFPIFEIGIPNLAKDDNTIKVRKFINYEFGLDSDTTPLQCVEYVQYKVKKELGITIGWPIKSGRDGGKWADIFEKYRKYKVSDCPKKFCAVSFKEHHGSYGHVAFVEEVLDGESIKISEANFIIGKEPVGEYCERTLSKSRWQNRYKGRFIDFS